MTSERAAGSEQQAGDEVTPARHPLPAARSTTIAISLAVTAALCRLLPLQWLHPLNWDEIEFYRATRWIAEGRMPYRDFWEHHSPLAWYLFAPFSRLTDSPGVSAIISMRWAQIPVWIATFWLINVFMTRAGLSRFSRWSAMAIALSSSWLMIAAVEYRIDPVACALYVGGLVLWQRGTSRSMFFAGVLFCMVGLTNIRFGPLLVVTVLSLRIVDPRLRAWKGNARANWIFLGGIVTLGIALLWFAGTHSLQPLVRELLKENFIGDKYGEPVLGQFLHRLIVVFGVRILGSESLFDVGGIDAGGIALLLLGFTGLIQILVNRRRDPDDIFVIACLQTVNLVVIAGMNFIYNYHFELAAILFVPLIAATIERIPRRSMVIAILAIAGFVNAFASMFRGKELDLAYQDLIMREVNARTLPSERVWAGIAWGLRREPAYWFWFLPDMTRHLVRTGEAAPYRIEDVLRNPPAVVVFDHYAKVWVVNVQRELAGYIVRHYIPVNRNLWVPGMNARVRPQTAFEWIVPRDGTYRMFASPELAKHRWFHDPLYIGAYDNADPRYMLRLPEPELHGAQLFVDKEPSTETHVIALRKGQRVAVYNPSPVPLGVILLPGKDQVIFRQPSGGATLEAASARVTHIPQFGVRLKP
jgi:hypothetical protein